MIPGTVSTAIDGEFKMEPEAIAETISYALTLPNSAAVDEYAVIPFIAQVQNDDYDYIYGYTNPMTNTCPH